MIKISLKNTKLGEIPNFNLPPVKSCPNSKECEKDCYARKAYDVYPNVRAQWDANFHAILNDFKGSEESLKAQIADAFTGRAMRAKLALFRIHSSGDFFNQTYLDMWIRISESLPNIRFLAFTKMHKLDYSKVPANMQVIFSMFPGMKMPVNSSLPIAWAQDEMMSEGRIPSDAIPCAGHCDTCGVCWGIGKLGKHVFFDMH